MGTRCSGAPDIVPARAVASTWPVVILIYTMYIMLIKRFKWTLTLILGGQILGMATSVTQHSYGVTQSLAAFAAFLQLGLPFAIGFGLIGLLADYTSRKKSGDGIRAE